MTYEQTRLETYNTIRNLLDGFATQNQLPASMLEDVLNKYLLTLKDKVVQEFINAAVQETMMQQQMAQQQESTEEEDGN